MLVPGEIFNGRFEVIRCIKAGGMGAVYEVLHLETQRRRALKTMLPELVSNAAYRERFRREATVAANVDSDHIVEVFDAGVDERSQTPFIVMELLRGEELGEALAQRGYFSPVETVQLVEQAARALDRAHAANIVHRDLKPENLFLARRSDGTQRLKILDFGIAKIRGDSTATGHTTLGIGSPLYMAPEQIRGQSRLGPPADTYALAHIAFTLLCGEAYWDALGRSLGSIYSLLLAKTGQEPAEPASVRARTLGITLNAAFDAWFSKATAQVPADRYQSASELVDGLAKALGVAADLERLRGSEPSLPPALPTAKHVSRSGPADELRTPEGRTPPRNNTDRAVTRDLNARDARRHLGVLLGAILVLGTAAVIGLEARRRTAPALISTPGKASAMPTPEVHALRVPPSAAGQAASATPGAAGSARIVLQAKPENAELFLDGLRLESNPAVRDLPLRGREHELRASAEGYATRARRFVVERPSTLHIELPRVNDRRTLPAATPPQSPPREPAGGSPAPRFTPTQTPPKEAPAGKPAPKSACEDPFYLDPDGIKRFDPKCE